MITRLQRLFQRRGTQLLIALFALTMFAIQLSRIASGVEYALFQSRWSEKKAMLDMLADDVDSFVERDADWHEYDYTVNIAKTMTRMDGMIGVYAAVMDESLNTLSERTFIPGEDPADPAADQSFREAVAALESGELYIPAHAASGESMLMKIYFRWVPALELYAVSETCANGRLLMAVAMNSDAIEQSSLGELIGWCVALIVLAAAVMFAAIFVTASRRGRCPRPESEAAYIE